MDINLIIGITAAVIVFTVLVIVVVKIVKKEMQK